MIDTLEPIRGLAEELRRQLGTKRDLMADTRRVSLGSPDGWYEDWGAAGDATAVVVDMAGEVAAFGATRHAHGQIATHLGIPWKLYERLLDRHPDLLAGVANGLLNREPSTRMLRVLDGRVRAFLSDRYRRRDHWDLLDGVVLPTLAEHRASAEIRSCDLTETRLYLKIALPDLTREIRVGDEVRAGVIVQNSEVGAGALAILPWTERLVCLNGAVHAEYGQRTRHVGRRIEDEAEAWELYSDATLALDDAAFFAKCRDVLSGALTGVSFDRIVSGMRDLAGIRPPDPVAAVEVLAERHSLTEGERGSMLSALVEGGDPSAWGLVNALTQTARDLADADRRVDLETLAGALVTERGWAA